MILMENKKKLSDPALATNSLTQSKVWLVILFLIDYFFLIIIFLLFHQFAREETQRIEP